MTNQGLELLSPSWQDYQLIDSGDFEKLERFGPYTLARPEPQAIWHKSLDKAVWDKADGRFVRQGAANGEKGEWVLARNMPAQWCVGYRYGRMNLRMRLGLTSFKHVGIFPEQAQNWNYIFDHTHRLATGGQAQPQILNLFAYTGGATLAAAAAGGQVTHVDSVRQVVAWARENMELSHLDGVRWIVDDALKFVKREVKRGRRYDGIILDPPAYGRGPDGEKWVLEQNIGELMESCRDLLAEHNSFLVLNLYSMGFSALLAKSAVNQLFGTPAAEQFGELYFDDRSGKSLPLGVYYRMER